MSNIPMKVFAGNSNPELATKISKYLKMKPGKVKINRFSDGEVSLNINESVRGYHCFVIQSTSPPVNENLLELLVLMDALKRASATEITVIIPYYGYGRQDRKSSPRQPITAKLVADLLETAGATRIIAMDLHAAQIQGFFDVPFDHLYATPIFIKDIRSRFCKSELEARKIVLVSPDTGGVEIARAYAKRLHSDLAIIDKRRPKPGIAEVMNVIGKTAEKKAIIIDDMIDTAGTLVKAAEALNQKGATEVIAYATHAVFSGLAIDRIEKSKLSEIIISDSIPLNPKMKTCKKIRTLSCAPLVGEAIRRVHTRSSISTLFL